MPDGIVPGVERCISDENRLFVGDIVTCEKAKLVVICYNSLHIVPGISY